MRIAMIGLGKLGFPVAHAISVCGHTVAGYDLKPPQLASFPHQEVGLEEGISLADELRMHGTKVRVALTQADAMQDADIVFIAVQTPHHPDLDGSSPNPGITADFEYDLLEKCLGEVCPHLKPRQVLAIISTVAPGTFAERMDKLLMRHGVESYVYTPQFIAMGTVISDFYNPEFWLVGATRTADMEVMREFYATISGAPVCAMDVASAEIVKMAYNTYIGLKIVWANNLMELADIFGGDADAISGALKLAKGRLASPAYMSPGMGDGGGCHPRDNLVLSHLAAKHKMSIDLGGFAMDAREDQTGWMAEKIRDCAKETGLPVILVGRAFKPDTKLVDGSPAVLLGHLLSDLDVECKIYDPLIDGPREFKEPALFFISTRHTVTATMKFPKRSVVMDPHRYMPDQDGVRLVRLGATTRAKA